jgi:CelD/BcsL family acetyltransferase involved in cellulose biosynthesis
MASGELTITVASVEEIRLARESWNALVARMRHPVIFLGWDWLVSWLDTAASGWQLQVLFVRDASGELVAILPLARARRRAEFMPFAATLTTFCGSLDTHPDHLDVICAADADGQHILARCFDFLARERLLGSVLYFPYLAEGGELTRFLASPAGARLHAQRVVSIISPFVDLAAGYEAYLAAMSKKKRYNLTRERKILCEDKGAKVTRVSTPEALGPAIDELFRLHHQRAQDLGRESHFGGETTVGFHRELAGRLLANDQVRLYQLELEGKAIATVYGFIQGGEFSFFQAGFDPEWKKLSPGKVLIGRVMEELAARQVVLFDFLGGGDEYKQFWATGNRSMESVLAFNDTMAGWVCRLGLRTRQFAKRVWLRLRRPKAAPAASPPPAPAAS